ncbi:hypothetical protein [Mastigocoleus sp. MO_188.B34]|uniref:hypothetical protein n=1 Tax=Mastigocoleus sp. MO_188.B34 TaxID=3036635 RepID=UPI0026325EE8|nr:hypothetical protein [Mastigocoleus sp. MO_188.B34]MDJ0696928.1 hypothetical protein [Mastigocoleus sp. MO_188.B34]
MSEHHKHEITRTQENILGIYEAILDGGGDKKNKKNDLKYDGESINSSINKMLDDFGNEKGDSIVFESKSYTFSKDNNDVKGDSISVKNKDGELIFENKSFTDSASQKDVDSMNMLQKIMDKYEYEAINQNQSQGLKISR